MGVCMHVCASVCVSACVCYTCICGYYECIPGESLATCDWHANENHMQMQAISERVPPQPWPPPPREEAQQVQEQPSPASLAPALPTIPLSWGKGPLQRLLP